MLKKPTKKVRKAEVWDLIEEHNKKNLGIHMTQPATLH